MRKIEINSHGYYAKGKFIDYEKKNNKLFAMVELYDGTVTSFDLSIYHIKFI